MNLDSLSCEKQTFTNSFTVKTLAYGILSLSERENLARSTVGLAYVHETVDGDRGASRYIQLFAQGKFGPILRDGHGEYPDDL